MAQLFVVQFPKYHFQLEPECTITFPTSTPLPFTHKKSKSGIYVISVCDEEKSQWAREAGLQAGLRIMEVHGDDDDDDICIFEDDDEGGTLAGSAYAGELSTLPSAANIALDHTRSIAPQNFNHYIGNLATNNGSITVKFRQEISSEDECVPYGLSTKVAIAGCAAGGGSDGDLQVTVSSFKDAAHNKHQVGLNNSAGYWSPTTLNTECGDIWLCIDLREKKTVNKLSIQGSLDHASHVTKCFVDSSDDGSAWKTHPLGIIDIGQTYNNQQYKTAVIFLWPVIEAQFVRVRPYAWIGEVALRLELYGPPKHSRSGNARVVTANTVSACYNSQVMEVLKGKPAHTKVVQIDCRALVCAALDRARCPSYGVYENADGDTVLVLLSTPNGELSERVINGLTLEAGINDYGVMSTSSIDFRHECDAQKWSKTQHAPTQTSFYESMQSRLAIKQVMERIIKSAQFTFDYWCMLTVASLIAVGGLATDSSVIVVASMLVSPIMGPVVAMTFGWTLGEYHLLRMGLLHECISLCLCIVYGFIVGLVWVVVSQNYWEWPTTEMSARGDPAALAVGAYIAAASGVGVALSVLGEYTSTVIGVAISASLLPPAVNCGMLFAFACTAFDSGPDSLQMAGVSFALTVENIIIIAIIARLMFGVKNVYIAKDQNANLWNSLIGFKSQFQQIKHLHPGALNGANQNVHHDQEFDVYAKEGSNAHKFLERAETVFNVHAQRESTVSSKGSVRLTRPSMKFLLSDDDDQYRGQHQHKKSGKSSIASIFGSPQRNGMGSQYQPIDNNKPSDVEECDEKSD